LQGLLNHPSENIRVNTVKTLQVLENEQTLADFMNVYTLQTVKVQLALLITMKQS